MAPARPPLLSVALRKKPVAELLAESGAESAGSPGGSGGGAGGATLDRSIGLWQLAAIGISCTVGTGIFFVLTTSVPQAGPAVLLSFVVVAIAAGLTALCYCELASAIPVSGSSYSYAYATLGEGVAFAVGACLLLEYGVAASATAVSWGEYLNLFTDLLFGVRLPHALSAAPGSGGLVNLPAVVLVGLCCLLLVRGARESAAVNAVMVAVKVLVLLLFVGVAATGFEAGRLEPFLPLGIAGVGTAASGIFFSFIGLDAISTAGEEVRNPRRTVPLALLLSLGVVTALYLAVALTALGAQPWRAFSGQEAGLAQILERVTGGHWPALVFAGGAVVSIFSVTLVSIYGQTRILYAMGRDGLLPPLFAKVSARTRTPVRNTVVVCVGITVLAAFVPLDVLADLTSMGTLVAFAVVSVGVMVLRRTQPGLERGFRVPGYPVTPVLSLGACAYLLYGLHWSTWALFGVWVGGAAVLYLRYGRHHSRLGRAPAPARSVPTPRGSAPDPAPQTPAGLE
ncbi:amino acid permease [Streptomyces sp. NPDC006422]|uniref:APC family permease n=1 Tax=unclassified Streptomyces TaxID=2593676 RepID=UPI0033B6CAB4